MQSEPENKRERSGLGITGWVLGSLAVVLAILLIVVLFGLLANQNKINTEITDRRAANASQNQKRCEAQVDNRDAIRNLIVQAFQGSRPSLRLPYDAQGRVPNGVVDFLNEQLSMSTPSNAVQQRDALLKFYPEQVCNKDAVAVDVPDK